MQKAKENSNIQGILNGANWPAAAAAELHCECNGGVHQAAETEQSTDSARYADNHRPGNRQGFYEVIECSRSQAALYSAVDSSSQLNFCEQNDKVLTARGGLIRGTRSRRRSGARA